MSILSLQTPFYKILLEASPQSDYEPTRNVLEGTHDSSIGFTITISRCIGTFPWRCVSFVILKLWIAPTYMGRYIPEDLQMSRAVSRYSYVILSSLHSTKWSRFFCLFAKIFLTTRRILNAAFCNSLSNSRGIFISVTNTSRKSEYFKDFRAKSDWVAS